MATSGGRGAALGLPITLDSSPSVIYQHVRALRADLGAAWIAYTVERAVGSAHQHLHGIIYWASSTPTKFRYRPDGRARSTPAQEVTLPPAKVEHLDALSIALGTLWKLSPESEHDRTHPDLAWKLQWTDCLPGKRRFDTNGNKRSFAGQSVTDAGWHFLDYMTKQWQHPKTRQHHATLLGQGTASVRLVGLRWAQVDTLAGIHRSEAS